MSKKESESPDLETVDTQDLIEELASRFDTTVVITHCKEPQRGQSSTRVRKFGTPTETIRLALIASLQLFQQSLSS